VTFSGRVFHSRAQLPEKLDRQWLKDGCVGQQEMMSMQSGYADEPRQQMTDGVPQQGTNGGAFWCMNSYTRTASLNLMRSGTFSQCNCVSSGVMRSYLDAKNTSRVAA